MKTTIEAMARPSRSSVWMRTASTSARLVIASRAKAARKRSMTMAERLRPFQPLASSARNSSMRRRISSGWRATL
ncbi:hypothetical protein D3C72_1730640 [compost metagenome]